MKTKGQNLVVKYATLLTVAEVGLGSFIHTVKIPFGGHALSLNQGLILAFAARATEGRREAVSVTSGVSLTSSILKALSPAGKRLTPMLAITVQGLGFASGIAVGGRNLLGVSLGMIWLSLWGFAQPVLVAYLLFGKTFFLGLQKVWLEFSTFLGITKELEWWVLGAVITAKIAIALALGGLAWFNVSLESQYQETIEKVRLPLSQPRASGEWGWRPILGDMLSPWFVAAFLFSLIFFYFSGERNAQAVWNYVLRPLVAGLFLFWAARSIHRFSWATRLGERWLNQFPTIIQTMDRLRSRT